MNFSAILIIVEIDDFVGGWFLNFIVPYENTLVIIPPNARWSCCVYEVLSRILNNIISVMMLIIMGISYTYDHSHIILL